MAARCIRWGICKIRTIEKKRKKKEHYKERTKFNELTDDQLLHSITKFIRNDIVIVKFSTEHDRTPAVASHSHSFHYMPNSLIQLLNWVTNDKTFNTGDNIVT
jgi:hypothetical protein